MPFLTYEPVPTMENEISIVDYLLLRLSQLGLRSVHGVPGDYNLTMLDRLEPAGLHWVGNANELNAGYAADGYARIKGIGALITSFGVGELSAINAIGGAYAEKVPVVHIVGSPPVPAQNDGVCLHHSLGDGNLRVFADMSKSVTVAQANLIDATTAPHLIDSTLKQCLLQSRPVYIEVPTDMVNAKIPAPTESIDLSFPGYSELLEDQAVDKLIGKMRNAQKVLVLVDGFIGRYGYQDDVNELLRVTGFPTLTTPFGKGLIDESLPNFQGIYAGLAGDPAHTAWVKSCDLVLHFGPLLSDINTYGFTAVPDQRTTVSFEKHFIDLGDSMEYLETYRGIDVKSLLRKVIEISRTLEITAPEPFPANPGHPRELLKALQTPAEDVAVDQYSFWLRMSGFFRPGDILMTETGTASYGGQSFVLPPDTTVINSSIWLSIGYMLAASQGVSLAQSETVCEGTRNHGRTILFEGDGSLQMSAQAISDIIRNRLSITIFILNNNGYTVERIIHGFHEDYNGIQPWRNLEAPSYFGAPKDDASYPVRTRKVQKWSDLQSVLEDPEIQEGKGLNMIEVFMSIDDAPLSLQKFVEYVRVRNSGGSS